MTSPAEDGANRLEGQELRLPPDKMLDLARQVAERLVERHESLRHDDAWRGGSRAELEALMREPAPEKGRSPEEVIDRAVRDILPVAGRVDHPRFFAFVPSSPTWPSILADFLAAGFNTFGGTWLGSSGPSQLELVVIDWIKDWIGYPDTAGGLFTSGGSAATLDAFVAAREWAGFPEKPTVYMSDQSHTAVIRAARIVGIRPEHVRIVPSDERFRIDLSELDRMVGEDRRAGKTPIAVNANAGATNTGAVDPLPELADYCARESLWMHVDAAYGGFAILSEAGKIALQGIERADSIAIDAHKWLFQPFETGCLMVKDLEQLERTFSVRPEYLQDAEWGREHPNFGDRGLQLTRSFRALKVWMSIQIFGMEAFRSAVTRGLALAEKAEAFIRDSDVLEVLLPASLSVVCFRVRPPERPSDRGANALGADAPGAGFDEQRLEALNETVQARVIGDGVAMMSSTRLRGTYSLRLCILNHTTTWDDVRTTLEAIERFGREELAR